MKKINVLTSEIANKISAGEVVERPASVVKELVENSVDAGADSIIVEIKNGGISYIRVTDNGHGISPEDIKTAFLPHATSKIFTEDDLYSIKTLGFRGEALSSIAAVSNVEVMSKTKDENGTYLEVNGGVFKGEETVACPVGTTIIVKNLFFNTPARMKFLKKDSTEASYITDIIERLVMSNPGISVRYIIDGREKLFVSGDGNLRSCIYAIYGRDYEKNCIDVSGGNDAVRVRGFVGKREISRGNRAFQTLFVNGRYVKNRMIAATVENAYKNNIMVGKFPFFVLCVDVPFESVDINVHPTKLEVKFSNEKAVCDCVYWAVKNALQKDSDEIREILRADTSFSTPVFSEKKSSEQTFMHITAPDVLNRKQRYENINTSSDFYEESVKDDDFISNDEVLKALNSGKLTFKSEDVPLRQSAGEKEILTYIIVGQLFDTYIILQLENEVVLVDQHAAHERMIYQKLVKANEEREVSSQILLSPVAITLSPDEYDRVEEKKQILSDYGFSADEFGTNTILVRQVPVSLKDDDIKEVILDIINKSSSDYMEENMHTIACKAAIKANKKLSEREISELVRLYNTEGGVNTCPHGRPIMIKITKYELEKMFKRIQ